MPTFNRAHFISDAIESVLKQTYENWELIILDDCSTDETEKIVNCLVGDIRIIYMKNEKNLGISKCRNKLLELATGDFIGHLDDDDILYPNAIEKVMDEFILNPHLDLVYSDYIKIDSKKNPLGNFPSPDFHIKNLPKLGFKHFCIYKKQKAMDIGGFNEKLPHCSDGGLFMRIANSGKCKRVPEYLYFYRCHDTNTGHKRVKCKECNFNDICDFFEIWKKNIERGRDE